jgi:putative riboflavin transport system permease protein
MALDTMEDVRADRPSAAPPPASGPPTARSPGGSRWPPRRLGRWLGPLPAALLGAALLGAWQLATKTGASPAFLLPSPASVAQAFWRGCGYGALAVLAPGWPPTLTFALLPGRALVTLGESLAGFAVGTLVAVPLGYAIARSPTLARALQPYLAASQAIPAVALAPLLVLWLGGDWLGLDLPPIIALCALIVFFPTAVNTALGIRLLDRDLLDAARLDGAGHGALLRHIELPLALPSILAGIRTSLTLSVTGAVVGEFVVGDQGLGGLLNIAGGVFDTPLRFATLFMLALLASALYGIARLAERRLSYLEA